MAVPGKKKLVAQEELRKLMKAKQRESSSKKRIESPLAKYNSLGHLSCVVCNSLIKSELLWPAHILGKQHKEKVAELKGTKATTSSPSNTIEYPRITKRKGTEPEKQESKRTKGSEDHPSPSTTKLPEEFFEKEKTSSAGNAQSLKLLAGDYEDEDDDAEEGEEYENAKKASSSLLKPAEIPLPPPTSSADNLPADFFENKMPLVSHSGSVLKADIQEKIVERKENTAEALPEGFFDDPEVDAKVRKVDAPKDQMDKEWEEFQKEIRQVNTVSEAIVAEEDEEGRLDRQIDEIDEQIQCYRRVEHLRDRKDTLQDAKMEVLKSKSNEKWQDEIGSDDEEKLPSLLYQDWREKGAFH